MKSMIDHTALFEQEAASTCALTLNLPTQYKDYSTVKHRLSALTMSQCIFFLFGHFWGHLYLIFAYHLKSALDCEVLSKDGQGFTDYRAILLKPTVTASKCSLCTHYV